MKTVKIEKSKRGSRVITISAVFTIVVSLIAAYGLKLDGWMLVFTPLIGLVVLSKMAMAMMFTQGWKVFKRKTIFGMPIVLFVFYVILVGLITGLTISNMHFDADFISTQNNIWGFVIAASAGLLSTFCSWYMGVSDWMAGGSEYDARLEFDRKGYSSEEIELKIIELRKQGMLS